MIRTTHQQGNLCFTTQGLESSSLLSLRSISVWCLMTWSRGWTLVMMRLTHRWSIIHVLTTWYCDYLQLMWRADDSMILVWMIWWYQTRDWENTPILDDRTLLLISNNTECLRIMIIVLECRDKRWWLISGHTVILRPTNLAITTWSEWDDSGPADTGVD